MKLLIRDIEKFLTEACMGTENLRLGTSVGKCPAGFLCASSADCERLKCILRVLVDALETGRLGADFARSRFQITLELRETRQQSSVVVGIGLDTAVKSDAATCDANVSIAALVAAMHFKHVVPCSQSGQTVSLSAYLNAMGGRLWLGSSPTAAVNVNGEVNGEPLACQIFLPLKCSLSSYVS
ncbi:hypothetical protein QEH59_15085 [Coraliomargarita sp. SDUM461004]|uniref:Uncharacterized protein n=1 Tax=Thalassobacterium sedimentorum TaxID=3041258 RepID=A0ABU1ALS6_9BACT|nr:hypothetical protein [Coraliomargarita sp. SDUM461004]MDQ8195755.1 hypothetical protein [Coraliomargarita sp. SDUM461004]